MREENIFEFKMWFEQSEELNDARVISSNNSRIGVAQTEVVISPNTTSNVDIAKQLNCVVNSLASFKHISKQYNLLDAVVSKSFQGGSQRIDVLMNVREDANLHASPRSLSVASVPRHFLDFNAQTALSLCRNRNIHSRTEADVAQLDHSVVVLQAK